MAGCSTLLVTVLIASVGEALPEIIHSIPKDSDSRLYGVEACGGLGVVCGGRQAGRHAHTHTHIKGGEGWEKEKKKKNQH